MAGNNANTKLLLHCNGIDTSTTFTDSSVAAPTHIVTANGDAQIDTAIKKWGTASGLFDGTGDYLSIPDSADWDIVGSSTDSQTVDFQIVHSNQTGSEVYASQREDGSNSWLFYSSGASGELYFSFYVGGTEYGIRTTYTDHTDGSWHHLALIKTGLYYGIYVDGNQIGYGWNPITNTYSGELQLGILDTGSAYFEGNMDEFRVQADNYFSAAPNSFPAAPLLLYCEGTDEDTSMSNDGYGSGAITFFGTAKLDDGATKFNSTTALLLDGNSDYITAADASGSDYDVMASTTDTWVVDFWMNPSNATAAYNEALVGQWNGANTWRFYRKSDEKINFHAYAGPGIQDATLTSSTTLGTGWAHVCFIKAGTSMGLYIDGVQEAYANQTGTVAIASPVYAGATDIPGEYYPGYFEQIQITKGNKFGVVPDVGLTTSFSVPTAVLTQDTITVPTEEYSPPAVGYTQAVIVA